MMQRSTSQSKTILSNRKSIRTECICFQCRTVGAECAFSPVLLTAVHPDKLLQQGLIFLLFVHMKILDRMNRTDKVKAHRAKCCSHIR